MTQAAFSAELRQTRHLAADSILCQLRRQLHKRIAAFPRELLVLLTLSGTTSAHASEVAIEPGDRHLVELGDTIASGGDNAGVDQAIDELENTIGADSVPKSCTAVGVMGIVGSKVAATNELAMKRAVDAVVNATTNDERAVRHAAVRAFACFAGIPYAAEKLPKVVALLDDESEWVADQAAVSLGAFGFTDPHVRDGLVAALDRLPSSDAFSLRESAARAIGRLCKGDREAQVALETRCKAAEVCSSRHECALALIRLNPTNVTATAALLEGIAHGSPSEAARILTWLPVDSLTSSQVNVFIEAAELSDSPKVLAVVRALRAEMQTQGFEKESDRRGARSESKGEKDRHKP